MTATDTARVLVVDDEPQITRVLRTVLASQGYEVRTAPDGESGLVNFKEWSPELVITDLAMPAMDGFQLLTALRADPLLRTTPVIIISAKMDRSANRHAMELGADEIGRAHV